MVLSGNGEQIGEALHRGCVPEQRKRREMAEAEAESGAVAFPARRRSPSLPSISSSSLPILARVRSEYFSSKFYFIFSCLVPWKNFQFDKDRNFVAYYYQIRFPNDLIRSRTFKSINFV